MLRSLLRPGRRPAFSGAALTLVWAAVSGLTAVSATVPPPADEPALLRGLRLYMGTFAPVSGEQSLLAYARRENLDWTAFQNVFSSQVTDLPRRYLDWRGHSATADGSVFTTLRAATFGTSGPPLLVVNREWCTGGACVTRTAFGWLEAGALRSIKEPAVIPLIRDADFYPATVPACLRGVRLDVSYLPSRRGALLSAMAVAPRDAQLACELAGVLPGAVTRPLNLTWDATARKFRRSW